LQPPVASASVSSAQRSVAQPPEGTQAVVDGDNNNISLLDDVGALIDGVPRAVLM
jgi:hypothetical protein